MKNSASTNESLALAAEESIEGNFSEMISTFNSSGPVPKEDLTGVVFVTCLWIEGTIGIYIMLQLVKYLQNKPPHLQSQLDKVYEVMLKFWIVGCFWNTITFTLPIFFRLSWELALVCAWSRVFSTICQALITIVGGLFRLILIFRPDKIEDISDSYIKLSLW